MIPVWYVKINEKKEGPYTRVQLRYHPKVTPDTLVWKEGFPDWKPLREVPELQDIFQDSSEELPGATLIKPKFKKPFENDELALEYKQDPYNLIWLLVLFIVLLYVIYRFYGY